MVQTSSTGVLDDEDVIAAPSPNWRSWSILVLLSVGAIIAFVDRTSMSSILAAKSFRHAFALSNVDRGTLASAFFWSYAALQIPVGWIVDRWGVKWPYAALFALWCLASAGTGLADSFTGLLVMRLLTGAGEAIVVPATYRWIRLNFDEHNSGTVVGIYMLGTKIGPAIGAPLAAWLIVEHDWRAMFLITGVAGLLWLVPWVLLVRETRADYAVAATLRRQKDPGIRLGILLANPMIWGTIIITFAYNYFVFYAMTWMPAYLVEQRGLSLRSSGLYSFFSFAGIGIVAVLAGWLADRLISRGMDAVLVRKSFVVVGFALACTEVLGAFSPSVGMALFWNILSLSGLGLTTANNLALCRLTLIPAPAVGLVTGIQNIATSLTGVVTPVLSGWLLQRGGNYDAPMEAILACLLIGACACIFLVRERLAPHLAGSPPVDTSSFRTRSLRQNGFLRPSDHP